MECPSIPLTTFSDFSERLYRETAEQRIPLTGSIEITVRCNLHCVHCYINLPLGDKSAKERELSKNEWFFLIDQIVDEGCLWLLFTGGEVFVRPDFLDIYTYAKQKGLLITLFTNGTTITPYIADYLSDWRPSSIEITLYGYTKETYEAVTGVPGSYERCIQGVNLFKERNLPLKLKSMIMKTNKHEIWDMKKYAEGLGIDFHFDPQLNLRLDGNRNPSEFRISPEEVVALDLSDPKRMKEWRAFCDRFGGPPLNPDYLYQCGAGLNTFHIDPYGELSACILSRTPNLNLRHKKFNEGWYDFMPRVRSQTWQYEALCRRCEFIALCGQCPGWAQTEHGDQESPVEYLCRIAHCRAEAFGLNVLEKGGKL
jgi:radical SAM protein with 4Fe4S-binding SPASM domain